MNDKLTNAVIDEFVSRHKVSKCSYTGDPLLSATKKDLRNLIFLSNDEWMANTYITESTPQLNIRISKL